jgi:hypothetical protein
MNHPHQQTSAQLPPRRRETAMSAKHCLAMLPQAGINSYSHITNAPLNTYLHLLTPAKGYQHLLPHKNECSKIAPKSTKCFKPLACPCAAVGRPQLGPASCRSRHRLVQLNSTQFNSIQPSVPPSAIRSILIDLSGRPAKLPHAYWRGVKRSTDLKT